MTESIERSALGSAFDVPTAELRRRAEAQEPKQEEAGDFSKTEFLLKDQDATEFQFANEPLPDEKISFFDVPKASMEEAPAAKNDPIEDALHDFKDEAGDVNDEASEEPLTLEAPSEISSSDFEPRALNEEFKQKSEVKAEDFAEIFSNDPIQVTNAPSPKKRSNRAILVKAAAALLVIGAVIGGFTYGFMIFKSDAGIAGYRLDGFSVVRAYRPPTQSDLAEFASIFSESEKALQNDNPQDLIVTHTKLKSVLEKDDRNAEAVSRLLDHAANLIFWYGTASPWSQRFDEHLETINAISKRSNEFVDTIIIERAKARKAANLGDFSNARLNLEKALTRFNTADEGSFLLLSEMSLNVGDKKTAEKWFSQASNKESRRARFIGAEISENQHSLKALGAEGYLPAQVAAFIRQSFPTDPKDIRSRLGDAEKLFDDLKEFPNLQNKLKAYKADLHQAAGESEKARELWKSLLSQYPKDSVTALKLAASFEQDALWDEAISAYQGMDRAGALDESSLEKYAELLRVRGRHLDAGTVITKGLEKFPKSARLYYIQGRIAFDLYQIDPAREAFTKALAAQPKFELATLGLVDIAMQRKEYAEVANLLKGIGAESPHHAMALASLGRLELMKGNLRDAEDFFLRAVRVDPKLESVYPQLVQIQLQQERDADAEKALAIGVKALPKSPFITLTQARVLQFQRRYDEALSKIEAIRKSHDHLLPLRFLEIDLLIDSKSYKEAGSQIAALVSKEVRDPELSYLKAKLFYKDSSGSSRDTTSGEILVKVLESAVRQNPESEKYRLMLARIASRVQDKQIAQEQVDAVIKVNQKNAEAWGVLGELQMEGGNYETASRSFKQALQLTRFRSEYYGKLAESFKQLNQPALAIEYYKKVIAERPQDAEAHLELGKLYNQEGRFSAALGALKKAVTLNSKLSEAYYFLGFIQKELSDTAGALKSFETFLSLEPASSESATIRDEVYFLKNGRSGN